MPSRDSVTIAVPTLLEALISVNEADAAHEKNTFLTFYSVKEAGDYARYLTEEAKKELKGIAGGDWLLALADERATRKF